MDAQLVLAVLGTGAGVLSAYYAYAQHRKSRASNTTRDGDAPLLVPKETKLWSTAVDESIEKFRKGRRECTIEITQQKNFDKPVERFSTSELVLHVRYLDANGTEDAGTTYRFELKINKNGDILEVASKGKRRSENEKFR